MKKAMKGNKRITDDTGFEERAPQSAHAITVY